MLSPSSPLVLRFLRGSTCRPWPWVPCWAVSLDISDRRRLGPEPRHWPPVPPSTLWPAGSRHGGHHTSTVDNHRPRFRNDPQLGVLSPHGRLHLHSQGCGTTKHLPACRRPARPNVPRGPTRLAICPGQGCLGLMLPGRPSTATATPWAVIPSRACL